MTTSSDVSSSGKASRRFDLRGAFLVSMLGITMTALLPILLFQVPASDIEHHLIPASKIKTSNLKVRTSKRKPRYFMVFSTSCSPFQNWQAIAFFHFAHMIKQPGNITRLVSGCKQDEADALRKLHKEKISLLSDRFHLHVTPDYKVGTGDQKYWNKPNGLLDYMENVLGFPGNAAEYNEDIIIIVDPDMMLLRPITHDFRSMHVSWEGELTHTAVTHGHPIAQAYAYGAGWLTSLNGNHSFVVGKDSPVNKLSVEDARKYYPAGPPYLATGKDMYNIAVHWVKFLPRLHVLFPHMMAEMHAYSMSAAHLNLPHRLSKEFMVSEVGGKEGFHFLDGISRGDACNASFPVKNLPLVLHYCQRYSLGRWFFNKYKLREDIFDCNAPLLRDPPLDVGTIYDWNIFPNGVDMHDYKNPSKHYQLVQNEW
eukprot:CAMPEP_0194224584 /NCGR_PEP_ID=MMETSP0156-20130528/37842_1 /TAXON_ID=33649 /ORGANISM="Thalassionema nitzschioides, Strain L26-B" /LENGTH=424 /DNA_ID=CAMNT_0038956227 /DNA_START=27 /DNA_END=1298 /DNA_ORIENTATION=+